MKELWNACKKDDKKVSAIGEHAWLQLVGRSPTPAEGRGRVSSLYPGLLLLSRLFP